MTLSSRHHNRKCERRIKRLKKQKMENEKREEENPRELLAHWNGFQ
jgi:hypothetical protein